MICRRSPPTSSPCFRIQILCLPAESAKNWKLAVSPEEAFRTSSRAETNPSAASFQLTHFGPLKAPPKAVFVVGDNRDVSYDRLYIYYSPNMGRIGTGGSLAHSLAPVSWTESSVWTFFFHLR